MANTDMSDKEKLEELSKATRVLLWDMSHQLEKVGGSLDEVSKLLGYSEETRSLMKLTIINKLSRD